MAPTYHIGQRLSFDSHLCTLRYIGPVAGTQKEWLGVEWDDTTRGKHDGEYQGVKYFSSKSSSKTAASFVRPTRTTDPAQSFVEAVHQKYAAEVTKRRDDLVRETQIEISGKVVEEVGFDKVRQKLAQLHELKIVIVDGMRVVNAGRKVKEVCPKIVELDLSRNLFEYYDEVMILCRELENLKVLRLNGNRLQLLSEHFVSDHKQNAFKGVKILSLDEMLINWDDVCYLVPAFPALVSLTADSNELRTLNTSTAMLQSMSKWALKSLNLDYNRFFSLGDIFPLAGLPCLETLRLKGNYIEAVTDDSRAKPTFGDHLQYVDLSYNIVTNWAFVDELPDVFPGLTALRFSHNPVYESSTREMNTATVIEEGYMFTVARIANLQVLNFSSVTPADRANAEMFYLSRIGKAMAAVPETEENTVTRQHRRYAELCRLYGTPAVVRISSTINPDFLEARLIRFNFYKLGHKANEQKSAVTIIQEIPKEFDIYQVKGIVGRLFGLRPLSLRLIWETGEWDPVAGYEDRKEDSDEEETAEDIQAHKDAITQEAKIESGEEKGRWMRREVELEDGTRQVGFWVDGMEAKVRVELLQQ